MKCTSPLLENMSGKLGGSVASKARGGIAYFRALVIPTNPNTSMQKSARDAMASAATLWRTTLTETEQEQWWDNATGGQTGQGLFTRTNQPRIFAVNTGRITLPEDYSVTPIVAPPSVSGGSPEDYSPSTGMTAPSSIVIDDSANTIVCSGFSPTDPWILNSDDGQNNAGVLYVYVSHQQSASRLSRQHPYQLIQAIAVPPTFTTTTAINLATYGFTTEAGKVMYVKLRAQARNGGISTDYVQRVTITA